MIWTRFASVVSLVGALTLTACASEQQHVAEEMDTPKGHEHAKPHGPHGHSSSNGHHRFDDAEAWAKRFEATERDGWQKPDTVLHALGLGTEKTKVVADIGSATGYFPVKIAPFAKHVFGVDIEPSMVDYLNARASRERIDNLTSVLGTKSDARLPEPVDVALIVNTYHHIENRPAYFKALALKESGTLVVVDFRPDATPGFGPPPSMRLDVKTVTDELRAAGYTFVSAETESLPHQYILVFRRTSD